MLANVLLAHGQQMGRVEDTLGRSAAHVPITPETVALADGTAATSGATPDVFTVTRLSFPRLF